MNDYITNYLAQFDIDHTALGEVASEGTQHYICHYQKNKVIKIPKKSLAVKALGGLQAQDILRDLNILNQYLPEYVADTRVLCADNGCYVMIQEVLQNSRFLTWANMPVVRDDFMRIIEGNKQIIRDHCLTLDLLGNIGYWRCVAASVLRRKKLAAICNLLLVKQDGDWTIKIVDINLTPPYLRCAKGISALRLVVDSGYYQMVRLLIKDNFGVDA
jgi:hypothetical protein